MKKILFLLTLIMTAFVSKADIYLCGANVASGWTTSLQSDKWDPSNPVTLTADSEGYYKFTAKGDFKNSTAKGDWGTWENSALAVDNSNSKCKWAADGKLYKATMAHENWSANSNPPTGWSDEVYYRIKISGSTYSIEAAKSTADFGGSTGGTDWTKVTLYLRGFDNWNSPDQTYKFGSYSNGKFTATFTSVPANKEYKIGSGETTNWSYSWSFSDLTISGNAASVLSNSNGNYKNSRELKNVTFTLDPDAKTLVVDEVTEAKYYYQIGDGAKTQFTTSTPELTVTKGQVVYLYKDNQKVSTNDGADVTVSGDIAAATLKNSGYGFKAAADGTMTFTLSENNTKVAVGFVADRTETANYIYKLSGRLNPANTSWEEFEVTPEGNTLTFSINFTSASTERAFGIMVCDENGVQLKENNSNDKGWYAAKSGNNADKLYTGSVTGTTFDVKCKAVDGNVSDFVLAKGLEGTVTLVVNLDATTKLPVSITITGGVAEERPNKTIYLVYQTKGDTEWSTMDPTVDGSKFKFVMPVTNGSEIRYKFVTDKSVNFSAASGHLYAPGSMNLSLSGAANANTGYSYWYDRVNGDGVYNVTAEFTNTAQTAMKFSITPSITTVSAGDFEYQIGDGAWTKVPNRVVVEGEYTQWNVTVTGVNNTQIKFRKDNQIYGVQSSGTYWLEDKNRYAFQDFETGKTNFEFKRTHKYQFIIRKFNKQEKHEVAVRRVQDADFTVYGFGMEGNHPSSYGRSGIGITDFLEGCAGQAFNAEMDYDGKKMSATPENNTTGDVVLHWVKYEHPFWGYSSAAQMEYTGQSELSVADALYLSDTYLYPEDPRVKTHFSDAQKKAVEDGSRNWSVEHAKDESFVPASTPHTNDETVHRTDRTFYRVYMTMEQEHGASTTVNSPKRAVVDSDFAGKWGSRVAYTAELPSSVADIVSGIVEVEVVEGVPFDGEAEYYTISGIRVYGEPVPGLYIVRRGSKVTKELIR